LRDKDASLEKKLSKLRHEHDLKIFERDKITEAQQIKFNSDFQTMSDTKDQEIAKLHQNIQTTYEEMNRKS
jgi:hypothetical protein